MADALKQNSFEKNYLITYVPLHRKRLNWRGYNQSELLAEEVSEMLGLKLVKKTLFKTKKTKSQIGLKRKDRLKNPEGAFIVNKKMRGLINGKKIIIVDDIVTTGATLNSCAKELRMAGAREVWGLVIGKH